MKFQKAIQFLSLLSILSFFFIVGCSNDDKDPILTPNVESTSPANNATNVPRNNSIDISFSEEMDPATINSSTIIVKQGTNVVPGMVTYAGTTATFTPDDNLLALTAYTVTVTTGAKTLAGKPFTANNVTSFTTGGSIVARDVVQLGTAVDYVIVAKTAINNSSTSTITGDLGLSPAATSYITGLALTNSTGFATSSQVTGKVYAADMVAPTSTNLTTTVNNMITAYNDAAGRTLPDFTELGSGNIGGKTLKPGLYKWTGNVTIPTNVVISGGANDVWIFQIAGNLTSSSATNITLAGDAQAKNIFWQVAGQVTLGTTSHFEGIILSKTGITLQTGASLNGQILAQTAVILDSNAIVKK
ncbi:MAG: ice-binding family protein [Chryseolinea sp.]